MDWARSGLGARNPLTAARTAAWIYLISAVVVFVSNVALPEGAGRAQSAVTGVACFTLVLLGLLLLTGRAPTAVRDVLLTVTPIIGVAFVVFLDVVTSDASAGAQVSLFLPALYAASQLKPLGAVIGAIAAVAGDAIVVAVVRPTTGGLLDLTDITLVIGLMTGLLVLAGQRQERLVARLQAQAAIDPLTGLVTRRILDEAMQKAVSGDVRPMPRQSGDAAFLEQGTALILIDLDHFKGINDTHGHPVGDDALVHVANLLGRNARPDTVIARLGGDEIAVLLPRCGADTARGRAQEFVDRVREHPLPLGTGAELTLSISVG
ncbi:GGDEF domain-containing protein, partial [Actinoplanes sp. NPDC049599]|uniref:GGDEF domain-containing protein n=1 Tax=Actinoplanes sp. NPDC049599 TaxID=3363903 RepID=UPI003793A757